MALGRCLGSFSQEFLGGLQLGPLVSSIQRFGFLDPGELEQWTKNGPLVPGCLVCLASGFDIFLEFSSPIFGEMIQFDGCHIFINGLGSTNHHLVRRFVGDDSISELPVKHRDYETSAITFFAGSLLNNQWFNGTDRKGLYNHCSVKVGGWLSLDWILDWFDFFLLKLLDAFFLEEGGGRVCLKKTCPLIFFRTGRCGGGGVNLVQKSS